MVFSIIFLTNSLYLVILKDEEFFKNTMNLPIALLKPTSFLFIFILTLLSRYSRFHRQFPLFQYLLVAFIHWPHSFIPPWRAFII